MARESNFASPSFDPNVTLPPERLRSDDASPEEREAEAQAMLISLASGESSERMTPRIRPARTMPPLTPEPAVVPRRRSLIEEDMVESSPYDMANDRLDAVAELLSTVEPPVAPEQVRASRRPVDIPMDKPPEHPIDRQVAPQNQSMGNVANPLAPLILEISEAPNRSGAIVALVEWLAKSIPGCSVRCGVGTKKLKRLFDSRLGWLGSESSLHRELSERWKDYLDEENTSSFEVSELYIRLSRPGNPSHALLRISGLVVSPLLFERLKENQGLLGSVLFGRPRIASIGQSNLARRQRVALIVAVSMVLLLLVCPTPYRAACSAKVEPINARVISAPFEATIETVLVEPGSEVKAGQPLVTLDGRPLRLEQQSLGAEIQQSTKQRDVAMAAGKIAESQLAQLKVQQLSRQQDLIERRLGQLTIVSPIDGIIVTGDLRRSIGAALETGQVLLEVASLDRVMIEIEIPEREIGLVSDSSLTQFRVESARQGAVHSTLRQIYPAAQLRDEDSVFIAPIELDNRSRHYRPGMRGKATVYGPIRPWAWPYVRGFFEQLAWTLGM